MPVNHLKVVITVTNAAMLEDAVEKAYKLQKDYPDAQVSVRVEM